MSEESTTPDLEETFRRSDEALGRRNFDGALAAYRPDAVWDGSTTGVGVFEGREAIRDFWEDWFGAYQDFEQVIEEFRDLGHGVTLVIALQRARLSGSGGLVELRYGGIFSWTNGLIQRVTVYLDIDEARAAAERLAKKRG
jgi:ketosteroid isomerase-like protein